MSDLPTLGQTSITAQEKANTTLDEAVEMFQLESVYGTKSAVTLLAKKDEKGDYPVIEFVVDGKKFGLWRDELAAVTFACARADQQSKLIQAKFRTYKEVPVRLVIAATKDIKKGELVVAWRKERVPIENEYSNG